MADEYKLTDVATDETWKKLNDFRWRRSSRGCIFQISPGIQTCLVLEQRCVLIETGESLWEPVSMVPE